MIFEDEDEDRFAEDEDEKGQQLLCNVGVYDQDSDCNPTPHALRPTLHHAEARFAPIAKPPVHGPYIRVSHLEMLHI